VSARNVESPGRWKARLFTMDVKVEGVVADSAREQQRADEKRQNCGLDHSHALGGLTPALSGFNAPALHEHDTNTWCGALKSAGARC